MLLLSIIQEKIRYENETPMNWLRQFRVWIVALFRKEKLDREMDAEMRFPIECQTQENTPAGIPTEQARAAARRQFGLIESTEEQSFNQRSVSWMENFRRDLRYSARTLRQNLGFTCAAVLILALGIGSNALVFAVGRTVLFHPLGFDGEDRLMWVRLVNTQTGATENELSWQDMEDIRSSTQSFESVATFGSGATWDTGGQSVEVAALRASADLAKTLRVRPALGRMFSGNGAAAAGSEVLISYRLWQSRFGGDLSVLGQSLRLDNKSRTIVGVLPPGLRFPLERTPSLETGTILRAVEQSFWLPLAEPRGADRTSRQSRMFPVVARLKAGVAEATARAELSALGKRLARQYPESNRTWGFTVVSFRDQIFAGTRKGIPLLVAAVATVLLICCVNLANLLLARSVARQREFAIRLALGAKSGTLLRSLMVENLLLALLGGGSGLALAIAALHLTRTLAAASVPFISEAAVDGTVVAFTACVSLATVLIFGLMPAWRQSRADGADALRAGPRTTGGRQIHVWQQNLLIGQLAMVFVLLGAAGLLLESFRRLISQDLGYRPPSVIAMDLSQTGFASNAEVCRFYRALRERIAALPGVEQVGTISSAPLTSRWTFNERPNVVTRPLPEAERPVVAATFVAFDYFQAMGIPLVEGRFFRDSELNDDGYGQGVILNETAAKLLFPGRSANGGKFTVGSNPDRVLEVIGVVKDTRDVRLEEKPLPRFYWQYAFGGAQVIVRGEVPAKMLIPMLAAVVRDADARVRLDSVRLMTDIVAATVADRRFLMIMAAAYTLVALAIAAIGIYGVVSYQVAQRRNEFGVRMALGATPQGLLRLVLLQTGRITLVGLAIGLMLSFWTNRLLVNQLFGLSPHEPLLLVTTSAILFLIASCASLGPAFRASAADPLTALRCE
jgi:predicted permease